MKFAAAFGLTMGLIAFAACTQTDTRQPAASASVADPEDAPVAEPAKMTPEMLGEALSSAIFKCDEWIIKAGFYENGVVLKHPNGTYILPQLVSASGTKYEGKTQDGSVLFWAKADRAMFQIDYGTDYGCVMLNPEDITDGPAELTGHEWLVEDINAQGVIDNFHATLTFEEGRVSGSTGCNRFSGPYQVMDDAIRFGPLMMTRKACAPAVMDLERKFTSIVQGTVSFRFDETGALILESGDQSLLAR